MTDSALPSALLARARHMGDDVLELVCEVHALGVHQGRREATRTLRRKAVQTCQSVIDELERQSDALSPAEKRAFETMISSVTNDPLVAAYFGGAVDHLYRCQDRLAKLDDDPT